MKSDETGVLNKSDLYFSSPSPTAKRLYYYLISAGHFYCTANYHLIRKNYDSLLVTHIIDGSFTFVVKGRHITARQGDTVLLDCFHPHEYYTNDSFESIWVHFNGPDCLNWYHEIIRNEGNLIQSGNPEQIEGLIFRLYDGIRTADATPEIDLSLELYRLLAEFARPLRSEENSLHYEANIRDAKQYVNEHLNQTIRVGDLAQAVHMSPSHFSRVFKQQTGFSPYDYVLVSRLNRAKEYLQKTSMTVSEIAYEVGFNSDTNFIFFFKSNTGLSSAKFRKLKF